MPSVDLVQDGPLAVVTLNAPPLNLFDLTMLEAFKHVLTTVTNRSDVRGLLINAAGPVVTGGADVGLFAALTVETGTALWRDVLELAHTIEDLPFPTVFAAHALCLTAGFEIALACDLLLAAASAKFGLVETVVALTPSMGGAQRLAERAGPARARELIFTGELYDSVALERWNVVNRVFPDIEFSVSAYEFAMRLATGPTRAHAATKTIVRTQVERGTRAADEVTPAVSGALFATADLKDAVQSFLRHGPGKATYGGV